MKYHSFYYSLQKNKRATALSLFQKKQKSKNEQKNEQFSQCSFFAQKKERSLIFKMSECLTLQL